MFTVKQLSRLAGITPRTLHYYDAIDLLNPSGIGANGYRYYGDESLLSLQQILLYREMDLPLDDIKRLLGQPDFDVLSALENHKEELRQSIMDEGNAVYLDLLHAMPNGPASPEALAGVERWRRHMEYFWTPNDDQLLDLAEGYNTDPRFKANFDQIDPNLAAFMLEAVKICLER